VRICFNTITHYLAAASRAAEGIRAEETGLPLKPIAALLVVACCVLPGVACAGQSHVFPNRPVRVIVPFPPLSGVDVVMRMFHQRLAELMGQPVVIDNRPGASGNVGTDIVVRAVPDGHTLLATTLPFAVNPSLLGNLHYDPIRDFAPVSLLAAAPFALAAYPALPVSSVRELVAYARVRPGELNYASAGSGSNLHVAAELFKNLAKLDIVHVPYKGVGPALAALIGGETHLGFVRVVTMAQFEKTGRLRALGVTSLRRSPVLPDVPTIGESGFPGYAFTSWYGVLAPRGTPFERVVALNGHFRNALRAPEIAERFARDGTEVIAGTPGEFGRYLRIELAKWARVVKDAGLKAE